MMCGVPRVSEEHLTARREQVLAAARTCFLRNGLHNTSMQDLIREADLSVGAVYRYFKSKNDIINTIAENVAGSLIVKLEAIAARRPPPTLADVMDQVLEVIDEQLQPDGNFPLALQIWAEATLDPAVDVIVRERYRGMRAVFVQIARHAAERGELPEGADVEAVSAVLFGMMPGFALQRLLVGDPDRSTYLSGVRALLAGPGGRPGPAAP
jgi:AcrR family transcriptional regulator